MVTIEMIKELREKTGAGMMDCKKALETNDGDVTKAYEWLKERGMDKAAKKADRIAAEGVCSLKVTGNNAVILEVNSETDFAAKSAPFKELVTEVTNCLDEAGPCELEKALTLPLNGSTVGDYLLSSTGRIGEKISLRRVAYARKADNQEFGAYIHMGGKIGALLVVEGNNDLATVAKDVAMHVAASAPQFIQSSDLTTEDLENLKATQLEEMKQDPKLANKTDVMLQGILQGKVKRILSDICLLEQAFVKDPEISVAQYLEKNGAKVLSMIRFGVGDGIEKRVDNFAEEVRKQIKQ